MQEQDSREEAHEMLSPWKAVIAWQGPHQTEPVNI